MLNFGTVLVYRRLKNLNFMKIVPYLFIGISLLATNSFSQISNDYQEKKNDSTETFYYIIAGDSIPREYIDLDEVILLNKIEFNSK